MVDTITPNDPRIVRKTAPNIRGKTYGYLLFTPPGPSPPTDTIILLHGFPDISLAWRNQVPVLLALNLRVVVPDNLGYGRTDAPHEVENYTMKNLSADIVELAATVLGKDVPFIVGGHDWGSALAWRVALWYPELIKAVFGVCVPYTPPRGGGPSVEDIIRSGKLPNFGYQLQLMGPDVEREIQGKERIRQFLSGIYGWSGDGKGVFSVKHGVLFDRLGDVGMPPNFTEEELAYYVEEIGRHGMRGPLNWYRVYQPNEEAEAELVKQGPGRLRLRMPALFVAASRDAAVPPAMSKGMDEWVDNLTRAEVDASHWVLWEKPEEFNRHMKGWLEKFVLGGNKASL